MACMRLFGQVPAPPTVSGDKNLEDRDIKERSIELERVRREANRYDPVKRSESSKISEAKFREIKEDFEQIQFSQNELIAGYTKGKEIDYRKIALSSEQINKRGIRLRENLFPSPTAKRSETDNKNKTTNSPIQNDIKSLIVEIDNTLAKFVANPIFTNTKLVNSADNEKARSDLDNLISLSAILKSEANKPLPEKTPNF